MNDLGFTPSKLVENLRELAEKIESGEATLQAGRFNVGEGFGVNVQPGWSAVVHVPEKEEKVNGLVHPRPGHDIEITAQPSKRQFVNMLTKEAAELTKGAVPMGGPTG